MSDIQDHAQSIFDGGFNCAESTILALAEYFNFNNPLIPRIATGFGGGMSRTKNICGAVTGGIMAIGLLYGRDSKEESKDLCYAKTQEFLSAFLDQFGSINCFELSGVDFNTPEGAAYYKEKAHSECCVRLVRFATEKISSMRQK